MLEKTLESPLDRKIIKPGKQPQRFIGRTDSEAETSILWPPDAKSWLFWKDPDVGKDWRQEEKGKTEDEMVRWHHWLNGHEFEQIPVDGEGQESLACCSLWGLKELDTTEQLKDWTTELNRTVGIAFIHILIYYKAQLYKLNPVLLFYRDSGKELTF